MCYFGLNKIDGKERPESQGFRKIKLFETFTTRFKHSKSLKECRRVETEPEVVEIKARSKLTYLAKRKTRQN